MNPLYATAATVTSTVQHPARTDVPWEYADPWNPELQEMAGLWFAFLQFRFGLRSLPEPSFSSGTVVSRSRRVLPKSRKRREPGEQGHFRARLDQTLNMNHELSIAIELWRNKRTLCDLLD